MNKLSLLFIVFCFIACKDDTPQTADGIINKAIEEAGGKLYEQAEIEFKFRKMKYSSKRNNGLYQFTRSFKDSLGEVRDVLNNDGLRRYRNGREEKISDSLAGLYAESVNSVHYFLQLPYGLNAPAVQKQLVGEDTIAGQPYYEIQVTFKQEGGGVDHEDIYMYWVNKDKYTIDFLAYRFFVNDGGIRFRVAYNPRDIKGIRFVDYKNFKTNQLSTPLEELDELYERGELEKVSEIKNEILKVEIR